MTRDAADGCAGGAVRSAPAGGTAEAVRVGTVPARRGRGVAAAVTHDPAAPPLGRGTRSVWPEYWGGGSRRVYGRGGFRLGGTRLYVSLEV